MVVFVDRQNGATACLVWIQERAEITRYHSELRT